MGFQKATKKQSRLRMAIFGPSGSGKTYSALSIAAPLGRIALIDTERGSASKYADLFEFDVLELGNYAPQDYEAAIQEAAGYDVLIIDSLSHAWSGRGGVLELVDNAAKRSQSNNSFTAWRDVTPLHNRLVDSILGANLHVIATMRSKTEYVMEENEKGKKMPRKIGLAPVQRDGMEYEFDVVAEMDMDNTLIVSKSRCVALTGAVIAKPDAELGALLQAWLTDGAPMPEVPRIISTAATTQTKWTVKGVRAFLDTWTGRGVSLDTLKLILRASKSWEDMKAHYPTVEAAQAEVEHFLLQQQDDLSESVSDVAF